MSSPAPVTVADCIRTAARFAGVSEATVTGRQTTRRAYAPRALACWLARELAGYSFPRIARHIGGRDHTTILDGHRRAPELWPAETLARARAAAQHEADTRAARQQAALAAIQQEMRP